MTLESLAASTSPASFTDGSGSNDDNENGTGSIDFSESVSGEVLSVQNSTSTLRKEISVEIDLSTQQAYTILAGASGNVTGNENIKCSGSDFFSFEAGNDAVL